MLIWDTTPIIKCVAEVSAKADRIDAAINWDELSAEKKSVLTEAKSHLLAKISLAKLKAGDGSVGHYVDMERIISGLRQAQEEYLNTVRKAFPYLENQTYCITKSVMKNG